MFIVIPLSFLLFVWGRGLWGSLVVCRDLGVTLSPSALLGTTMSGSPANALRAARKTSGTRRVAFFGMGALLLLGPPVVPFYPFFGEGSPTKIDYRKKDILILTSLLEDLA